ncbi:acyl-CoA carboxylase subunit epsilon [Streptomyces sp. NBC_00344]|uniref:acyl-CoA carboxylase subunit epsilon n=1 Tax=Streptomyces sp. NBC_00344 TaxID=2975720 RepID=UPI002E2051A5
MTPDGHDRIRVLHGNPSNEDLAVLLVVLHATAQRPTATPDRSPTPKADWADRRQGPNPPAGSWRTAP